MKFVKAHSAILAMTRLPHFMAKMPRARHHTLVSITQVVTGWPALETRDGRPLPHTDMSHVLHATDHVIEILCQVRSISLRVCIVNP